MFKAKIAVNRTRPKNYVPKPEMGIVQYVNNRFSIIFKDKCYKINGYDFKHSEYIYSKPCNDQYDTWSRKYNIVRESKYHSTIADSWSTIYHGQKLEGYPDEYGEFIIKTKY